MRQQVAVQKQNNLAAALREECAKVGQVLRLEGAGIRLLRHAAQGLCLAGERAVVDLGCGV